MLENTLSTFHNIDVKELNGVAIMTDTDNSKIKSNILLSKYLFFF